MNTSQSFKGFKFSGPYRSGYASSKSIFEQVDILCSNFPALNPDKLLSYAKRFDSKQVPLEGLFVLIRRGFFGDDRKELAVMLGQLEKLYGGNFFNQEVARMNSEVFYPEPVMTPFEKELFRTQGESDLLLVAGQLGASYRGLSAKDAHKLFAPHEFGLFPKDFATMLLTHPERLKHKEDLAALCSGSLTSGVRAVFSYGRGGLETSYTDPLDSSPFHRLEFAVQKDFVSAFGNGCVSAICI